MNRTSGSTAWIATSVLAVASLFQVFAVAERVIAAAWQWHKFKDYGGGGHIMLSRETAAWFIGVSVALVVGELWLGRGAKEATPLRRNVIKASWALVVLGVVIYFFLAFSPLNAWRP